MENKYYTPDIEDIRVGYECELWSRCNINIGQSTETDCSKWIPFTLKELKSNLFIDRINEKRIRTPYLTKEQIEAEGWKHSSTFLLVDYSPEGVDETVDSFKKDNYFLSYNYLTHIIRMIYVDPAVEANYKLMSSPEQFNFWSYCPSINEFRTITRKQLKIT